ncbi:hypothetical protein L1S32_00780 [Methanogenium sp. S4BF]|uniref:hypothetical protein n=1 Tax=Methanogenium sp. S4BF TaxID=1789226 RepID=UPI0024173CCD|nr:hypothetical protein [Methanogenium sp. S4BF]WFN34689.1 hypothetical protein L1S32_00780 [Methanogenium sp. S4BF]
MTGYKRITSGELARTGMVLIAIWFCILPVCAFTVTSGPSVVPDGHAVIGEAVTADIEIIYDVSSMNEFITVYTDMGSDSWDAVIIADGREMPIGTRSGRYLTVTGFELYNPGASVTKLQVHLEGVVPEYLAGSGDAEVLSLEHIAGDGVTVLDSVSERISLIDLAAVNGMRTETENDLIRFEEQINRAYNEGSDTSAAEEVAADARDLIEASLQMDLHNAYTALSEAKYLLSVGRTTLTDSVTQDFFQNTEGMISAIEPAIAEYRGAGGADKQGVLVVLSYRDNAEMLLILAHDRDSAGDDEGAQRYAEDAYAKAGDAMAYLAGMYTEAGLTMGGYTPGAGTPPPSSEVSATTPAQVISLPYAMDPGVDESVGDIDIEGTLTFFQVVLDGILGMAEFVRNVMDAFSEIGN